MDPQIGTRSLRFTADLAYFALWLIKRTARPLVFLLLIGLAEVLIVMSIMKEQFHVQDQPGL